MSPTSTDFDADTEPRPLGDGRYGVELSKRWWITAGPNGGYVAAVLLRAMSAAAGADLPPRSVTVHFPRAPGAGTAEVVTEIERRGRSTTFVSARMLQGGEIHAVSLGVFSLARRGPDFDHTSMPVVPGPDEREELDTESLELPVIARYRAVPALGGAPFSGGEVADTAAWLRPRQPRPLDAALATAMLDVWYPAPFLILDQPVLAPTLEYTVHFNQPLPLEGWDGGEWHLAHLTAEMAEQGHFTEDASLWSRDGRLLARARQLALLRTV